MKYIEHGISLLTLFTTLITNTKIETIANTKNNNNKALIGIFLLKPLY
jgi:hypothetical protein